MKRILAAFICAAALGLAGCASSKPMVSDAAQGKTDRSRQETEPGGNVWDNFELNAADPLDWSYNTKENAAGERTIEISGYTGDSSRAVIPSEINGVKVTGIGDIISRTEITSITIPASVEYITQKVFTECSSLSEVIFKGEVPEFYGGLIHVFEGTPWLETLKAKSGDLIIIGNVLVDANGEFEGDVTIPAGVKKIGNSALNNNGSVTSVTIPAGVTEIGDYAFEGCSEMESITIPEGVTKIGYGAFDRCFELKRVNLPESIVAIDRTSFEYGDVELIYKGTVYSGIDSYQQLCEAIKAGN